ncbi:est [Symbiodinium natans]|uniref:Est protein n=1 Tax=Symbiodinium natans TaxID=878477 RepID=A0A812TUV2_9DINO|nr:est [Symbiodinium natans]
MSTFSLQSPPGVGPVQPSPPPQLRVTSNVMRPVGPAGPMQGCPVQGSVPGYYVRGPAPAIQAVPGAPRPVPGVPGIPGVPGVPSAVQTPIHLTRPVRWSVPPGVPGVPGASVAPPGPPGVSARPHPVPVVPKQPIQMAPPVQAVQAVHPVPQPLQPPQPQPQPPQPSQPSESCQPTQPRQPSQPVHPMQVLAQSLAALATPQAEQQEPETSEETHQSEDSSETSPATGEATLSPPPDSPNTDLVAPEAARNTTVKVEPAAPLVDRIAGKNAADLESMESHGPVGSNCTKAARHREQPALASLAAAFVAGMDDAHLQRGCEATVRKLELPEAGLYPDTEDAGLAEWPTWVDSTAEDASRGGAIAFLPSDVRSDSHCIYFIHGGGFEYGSPLEDGYDSLCSRIAAGSGLVVVCPDHPLSGENRPFKAPEILDGLLKGLRWLLRFDPVTKERRISAPKVIVAGDSAGATQALSTALRALAQEDLELSASICGLILISPWLDLSCGSHTYVSNAYAEEGHTGDIAFREHADDNRASFRRMAMTYTGSPALLKDPVLSPYWLARNLDAELGDKLAKSRMPIWICAGAAETLVGEVLDFAERLRGKVPVEAWLHEGMFHDWVMYTADHPLPSKDTAMNHMFDFLTRLRDPLGAMAPGIHYYIDEWK